MPCHASSCGLLQDEKKEGKKRIAVPWYVRQKEIDRRTEKEKKRKSRVRESRSSSQYILIPRLDLRQSFGPLSFWDSNSWFLCPCVLLIVDLVRRDSWFTISMLSR
ncbi:hypothetical protein FOWG_12716 [Fusarium oxysporum f. sp. lycopersici MN25]|uniref:Uncharacterized protein n=1 Tax=Fusarium oxysporum Fo47 TaxID=660027 RepID=W9KCY7_FUSOX|nr:hypothetical protein FOZG_08392 [Fusarium oxysporum Fo47]EWZ83796.1 hypothetical protein FOWG_12716 [Fusarium oxysporum f. sp. lycopersici MN25]